MGNEKIRTVYYYTGSTREDECMEIKEKKCLLPVGKVQLSEECDLALFGFSLFEQ